MSDHRYLKPKLAALLETMKLSHRLDSWDAVSLVSGEPHHRTGLWVLRRYPLLAGVLCAQLLLVGLLAYEISLFTFNLGTLGAIPVAETRVILLGGIMRALQDHFAFFWHFPLASVIVAVIPYALLFGFSWALMCGIICHRKPSWRWWAAVWLSLVPLRFTSSKWFAGWTFWKGNTRILAAGEARVVQFSRIFTVVNGTAGHDIEDRWMRVLDARLKEVVDAYFSFMYIPYFIFTGCLIPFCGYLVLLDRRIIATAPVKDVAQFEIVSGVLNNLNPVSLLIIACVTFATLSRVLLGLSTFFWLAHPERIESPPNGSGALRFFGFVSLVATIGVAVIGLNASVAPPPVTEMSITLPFDADKALEVENFFGRLRYPDTSGQAVGDAVYGCLSDDRIYQYLGSEVGDGQRIIEGMPTFVAKVVRISPSDRKASLSIQYLSGVQMGMVGDELVPGRASNTLAGECRWIPLSVAITAKQGGGSLLVR